MQISFSLEVTIFGLQFTLPAGAYADILFRLCAITKEATNGDEDSIIISDKLQLINR